MNSRINLKEWWPWYNKILDTFGYDRSKDQLAADVLSRLISGRAIDLQQLKVLLSSRSVLVFGAGPSLEEDLQQIAKENLLKKCAIISADGATTALLKVTKVPSVVVTDLDGNINDLLRADRLGSVMVVHGHGDNIDRLRKYVPKFKSVVGTTQVEPRPSVYNFGGFTDGDRAVFLATVMGAKLVALAGMDLGRVVGKYSKKKVRSVEVKISKLKICKELLEWCASRVDIPLYNVTGRGESIEGFIDVTSSELIKIVDS
ncbi:MAG: 6-hydroxymethylpterin diphosphokinase MptE-like protein [Candidatus Bathyarchaeia archaeon]